MNLGSGNMRGESNKMGKKRADASGKWKYKLGDKVYVNKADGHTVINADAIEEWSGTFEGAAYDIWFGVWDTAEFPPFPPVGNFYAHGRSKFENAQVMGKKGSLVILWKGDQPKGEDWKGEWTILSATGELKNLYGRGKWWGPSFNLDYSGQIHFEDAE
jgi:hypothetical protein